MVSHDLPEIIETKAPPSLRAEDPTLQSSYGKGPALAGRQAPAELHKKNTAPSRLSRCDRLTQAETTPKIRTNLWLSGPLCKVESKHPHFPSHFLLAFRVNQDPKCCINGIQESSLRPCLRYASSEV